MSFGDRGECPECGRDIGLIAGEHGAVLRRHVDDEDGETCSGTGKFAKGQEPEWLVRASLAYAPGF